MEENTGAWHLLLATLYLSVQGLLFKVNLQDHNTVAPEVKDKDTMLYVIHKF